MFLAHQEATVAPHEVANRSCCFTRCCCPPWPPAEAQEFKKKFEEAAEQNSKLINMAAVPTAAGDGSAQAADALADELGKAKVEEPAASTEEPAAEAAAEEKAAA